MQASRMFGVTAVLVAALSGCGKGDKGPPLSLRAEGAWGPGCQPSFELAAWAGSDATLEILGKRLPLRANTRASVRLTPGDIGDAPSVTVNATGDDGSTATTTVMVPTPNRLAVIDRGTLIEGEGISLFEANATVVAGTEPVRELSLRESSNETATAPDHHIIFVFDACNLALGTTRQGAAEIEVDAAQTRVDVDVARLMWTTAGTEDPDTLSVRVTIAAADGSTATLTIDFEAPAGYGASNVYARFANVAEEPLADAPMPADVASPRPIAAVWDTARFERRYLGSGSPASAPYVALLTTTRTWVRNCFYEGYTTGLDRSDVEATLFEARTGKLVGHKRFAGPDPSCSPTLTIIDNQVRDQSGRPPTEAIDAWLDQFRG